MWRELNYRAVSAQNATAAMTVLEQRDLRIDLPLTDVVMPGRTAATSQSEQKNSGPD